MINIFETVKKTILMFVCLTTSENKCGSQIMQDCHRLLIWHKRKLVQQVYIIAESHIWDVVMFIYKVNLLKHVEFSTLLPTGFKQQLYKIHSLLTSYQPSCLLSLTDLPWTHYFPWPSICSVQISIFSYSETSLYVDWVPTLILKQPVSPPPPLFIQTWLLQLTLLI